MENKDLVDNIEKLEKIIKETKKAQARYAKFSQAQVDKIFKACAIHANNMRIPFAKMAFDETKMGVLEDKVIKNHYASEFIYNKYKDEKTVGVFYSDDMQGIEKIYEPIGTIGAIIPTTNPTSTAIFKILLCLKTRNGIIISPHPRAKESTIFVAKELLKVAVENRAPDNIISWVDKVSLDLTNALMKNVDTILATGGMSMVKSAYSSSKPAIGVGSGNVPALLHKSCDIELSVNSIIHSKTFDNGMICASEQSVIIDDSIYDLVKKEFLRRNCYITNKSQTQKLRDTIIINGAINANIVGQSAYKIASHCGFDVPESTKILISEVDNANSSEELAHEKLSPILAMYRANNFDHQIQIAKKLIECGGLGHTSSIFIDEKQEKDLNKFVKEMKTCRIVVNSPSSHGGIGDIYNFSQMPSLTLGCGSWGGNSISENVGIKHLLNIKTVAKRRKNMLWLRVPQKVFIENGCLKQSLLELKKKGIKKAFIVTDQFLFQNGYTDLISNYLKEMNIEYSIFSDVVPDPTLENAKNGLKQINEFNSDCIIAYGGGSSIDAAKIIWVLYEHPEEEFLDLAMRFMDIQKRIYTFPKMGEKAYFVAIPTTAGTGSEVTPFAVITDEKTGIKYPLADYELMPNMAIVDSNLSKNCPKQLTASSGIDALVHDLEALVSVMATDYTDALAIESLKNIFKYLPSCYKNGSDDMIAREKMANASTMAGIAFANANLGLCHSMAHKLGSIHHLPHGIANALVLPYVIKYNSSDSPTKMATFSKYDKPHASKKYSYVADCLGFGGKSDIENIDNLISEIEKLKENIGIKKTIKEYGINEKFFLETLDLMSEMAFDDQCTGSNPRYPLIEEIKQLYKMAYYGGDYDL